MTTAPNPFQPAVKAQLKARVAFDGPTGSGKTWTALKWATVLAGNDGKIAFVDTERDSARLYANHFSFDVLRFDPPYEVDKLIVALNAAEASGYTVVVIDSLSHFWMGEGGVLDEVDSARKRQNADPTGWQHGTPLQRHMVDTFLALDMHVIVTMRSKMEYVIEEYDDNGRKRTRVTKLGLKPVQREGLEYEFQIVGDMDLEHCISITKTRCDVLGKTIVQPNRETEAAETFLHWLNDGTPPPPLADAGEVVAFLAQLKEQPEAIRFALGAWWKDAGLVKERMTQPELDSARAQLADLLIASAGGAEGEPGGEAGDAPDAPVVEQERSEDASTVASNGSGSTASPNAEGGESPQRNGSPPDATPDAPEGVNPSTDPCVRCGSTRASRMVVQGEVVCEIVPACRGRMEAAKAASAA